MNSNFFVIVFFAIGVIICLKGMIKTFAEMRIYWNQKVWGSKKDFLASYVLLKSEHINILDITSDCYPEMGNLFDEPPEDFDETEEDDMFEDTTLDLIEEENSYTSVELFVFRRAKSAEACQKALGESCIDIYKIEGKHYMMVAEGANERYIKGFGGRELKKAERERIFSIIVKENTMIFEFTDPQKASFFVHSFGIQELLTSDGHFYVDMSNCSKEQEMKIRFIASECYGEEVTDGFLVEEIKKISQDIQ